MTDLASDYLDLDSLFTPEEGTSPRTSRASW